MIQAEMPMQCMPTAPEIQNTPKTTPKVRTISTPVYSTPRSVRPRTPSRRIQIVEEFDRSSSEETMPYNQPLMPYRTVRINETPQVRTLKRRAPPAPQVWYSKDDVPMYLMESE